MPVVITEAVYSKKGGMLDLLVSNVFTRARGRSKEAPEKVVLTSVADRATCVEIDKSEDVLTVLQNYFEEDEPVLESPVLVTGRWEKKGRSAPSASAAITDAKSGKQSSGKCLDWKDAKSHCLRWTEGMKAALSGMRDEDKASTGLAGLLHDDAPEDKKKLYGMVLRFAESQALKAVGVRLSE